MTETAGYRDGTDLILSVGGSPLGHSTGCKISDSSETGERTTKEQATGKWKEKYVKSLSESISADGFVYKGDTVGLPKLKELWMAAKPVTASYQYRDEPGVVYSGEFIITSLENDGQAGDDEKYSITLENSGAITNGSAKQS